MANEQFIFTLGADISKFTKSITEVEAELKSVRNTLKTQTHGAIAETNAYIQQLEDSLVNLKKVGFSGVAKGAQQGQTALFALGQVARDLPFGFIAIQNNLPLLVDQFVALKQSTGGATKALGAILNSIAGPAGLAFAFGVATSAITGLVQEYGSLSNAFGQLLGLTSRTKIATEDLSKAQISATASGIAEAKSIDTLIEILSNSQSTYQQRLGAYEGLKNIMPDVISALDKEKIINADNLITLKNLAAIKKENIILDGTRQALIKAIEKESTNAFTQLATLQKQDFFADIAPTLKGILKGYAPFLAKTLEVTDQIEQSSNAFQYLSDILKNVDSKIATNTGTIQQQIDAYKKQLEAIKNNNKEKEKQAKLDAKIAELQDKLLYQKRDLIEFEVPMATPSGGVQFDNFLKKLKEQAKIQKELKQQQLDLENQKVTKGFLTDAIAGFKDINIPKIEDVIFDKERMDKVASEYQKLMQQRFDNIKSIVENTLTAPLTYLFDTILEGGKISWKELGNIIIDQLKRIAVQVATTAAAVAVADLLTKGGYSQTVRLFNKASSIVDKGTGVGVTKTSAVNFGGLQGGLGLSGQVVFVQRGSDLVGVINRANATINRVG